MYSGWFQHLTSVSQYSVNYVRVDAHQSNAAAVWYRSYGVFTVWSACTLCWSTVISVSGPPETDSWRLTRLLLRVTKNYPSPLSVAASFRADENEINNASITLSRRERDGLFHSSTYSSVRAGSFDPYRLSIFATNTSYMLSTRLLSLTGRTGLFWMKNLGMI